MLARERARAFPGGFPPSQQKRTSRYRYRGDQESRGEDQNQDRRQHTGVLAPPGQGRGARELDNLRRYDHHQLAITAAFEGQREEPLSQNGPFGG